jgi:hypothetical protein
MIPLTTPSLALVALVETLVTGERAISDSPAMNTGSVLAHDAIAAIAKHEKKNFFIKFGFWFVINIEYILFV